MIFLRLFFLVSKENDLDSNASSIDTDMEDNLSQDVINEQFDPLAMATPVADSVLITPANVDVDLENVSLNENDDYLSDNLSHIHLLHPPVSNDPNFNHRTTLTNDTHNIRPRSSVLHYFADTSSSNQLKTSPSKPISTPSPTNSSVGTSFDMNQEMTFLCDLMTPPTSSALRPSISTQSNPNFFDEQWNT